MTGLDPFVTNDKAYEIIAEELGLPKKKVKQIILYFWGEQFFGNKVRMFVLTYKAKKMFIRGFLFFSRNKKGNGIAKRERNIERFFAESSKRRGKAKSLLKEFGL